MNAKIVEALEDARWMDALCEFLKKMLKEEWISEEKRKFLIYSLGEQEETLKKCKEKLVDLMYEKNSMGYFDKEIAAKNDDFTSIKPFDPADAEFNNPSNDEDEIKILGLKTQRSCSNIFENEIDDK